MSSPDVQTMGSTKPAIDDAADAGKKRKTFFSFGDQGVTATVGSTGRLLRVSQYFPAEKTGFCVDGPTMPEPWQVRFRFRVLNAWAEHPESGFQSGIGPSIRGCSFTEMINDRWPIFEGKWQDGTDFTLQYFVLGSTVYQKFEFSNANASDSSGRIGISPAPPLSFETDLFMRELDFIQPSHPFNGHEPTNVDHYKKTIRDNYLTREHLNGEKKVVLHVHALDENSSLKLNEIKTSPGDHISSVKVDSSQLRPKLLVKEGTSKTVQGCAVATIILAYTLRYIPKTQISVFSPPAWGVICKEIAHLSRPFPKLSLTNNLDNTLDFFLRRNLEYILSVCSIPIPDLEESEVPFIALTCGDVDSHRVTTPASFYAFQFLLLALDYFGNLGTDSDILDRAKDFEGDTKTSNYVFIMRKRIYNTCHGHVKWLFQRADVSGTGFSPNYWVNGEEIRDWKNNEYLPGQFLANAPFQIIKACGFLQRAAKWKRKVSFSTEHLNNAMKTWIKSLDGMNQSGHFAFPRLDKKPTKTFYLADHALIWQAVKSAEAVTKIPGIEGPNVYSSNNLRRNMLKRFTTENPQSKKRMIASTRSPIQTRFFFRSRDIGLFPAMDLGFFDTVDHRTSQLNWEDRNELWTNTADCQKHHEENDDLNWRDPRKFLLSVIMAKKQKRMNVRTVGDMYEHAMSVLLGGSSANGLFPGWLDAEALPDIYRTEELRDTFWEVTFETPYILWMYCHKSIWHASGGSEKECRPLSKSGKILMVEEEQSISEQVADIRNMLKQGPSATSKSPGPRREYTMKHAQPFSNKVDEENIVERQDEWLYNEPSFFTSGTQFSELQVEVDKRFVGFMLDIRKPDEDLDDKTNDERWTQQISLVKARNDVKGLMGVKRDATSSMKRIWFFFSEKPSGNEACLNTTFVEEPASKEVTDFYRRHQNYAKFFEEETDAVLNTWATELHLSFYRLDHSCIEKDQQPDTNSHAPMPSLPATKKGDGERRLVKVAIGFRIEGDLFNHYWTCRVLEADKVHINRGQEEADVSKDAKKLLVPWQDVLEKEVSKFIENNDQNTAARNSWQQRRVLELKLFGRILERMVNASKEVLAQAWLSLHGESKAGANEHDRISNESEEREYDMFLIATGDIVISRKRVEQVQRVLRTLAVSIEGNIAQIVLWQGREIERQIEKPQWTFVDESHYRVIIHKELLSNNHQVLRLKRNLLKITKLEESLVKKLEIIRSDLEERRGGETQLFTYVTAVFLPLSFATSIFSMSEDPKSPTLHNMIRLAGIAVGAVALLYIALMCAMSTFVQIYWVRLKIGAKRFIRLAAWMIWKSALKVKNGLKLGRLRQRSRDTGKQVLPGPGGISKTE